MSTRRLQPEDVAASALRLGNVAVDGSDLYWIEGRPAESGRSILVRRASDGTIADVTPPGANVRTRVQEYGGAAFAVSNRTIYYSEFADGRIYQLALGAGNPLPLTPPGARRYADFAIDPVRPRLVCVCEERDETTLVSIAPGRAPHAGDVIASGSDFYSTPRFSPDGAHLAWLSWRHPQMPWDGTELWLADVDARGAIGTPRLVAGGVDESIFEPGWSPDGRLLFVSDRTGWWNLYRVESAGVEPVHPIDADCGRPQWTLGTATWAFAGSELLVTVCRAGMWQLVSLGGGQTRPGEAAISEEPIAANVEPSEYLAANGSEIVLTGGSPTTPDSIVRIDPATRDTDIIRSSSSVALEAADISMPEAITFPTANDEEAHGFFYPAAGRCDALIVIGHGGPTSATSPRLNIEIQFWTSNGFAVVDVNYRGSSGYGRAYRQRLNGNWGIVDVADCVHAAEYLAREGRVPPRRAVIRGRSAGGFTALAALTQYPRSFAAGAIYYGVADLELLARDTHKFESRYLDRLVGPYPAARNLYRQRSPIHHVARIVSPLIVFQGLDDRVVPPEQSCAIVSAARANGVRVELIELAGEGHGFRRAETIVRCLTAELSFYRQVL